MKNFINKEACTQCRLCVEICPCHIYGLNEQNEVYVNHERESICQVCGQYMSVCKEEAIRVEGLSYNENFFDLPENKVGYDDFIDFLSNRRSVRHFKDKPVSDEVINKILDSIAFAPYGAMPEKMHVTVINNSDKIGEAKPYFDKFMLDIVSWIENPIASFFMKRGVDKETFNTVKNHLYPIVKLGNYDPDHGDEVTRNAPALLLFHAKKDAEEHTDNSLIYATYAMLAAQSLGLGTTMNGIVPPAVNRTKKLREIFRIPGDHEVVISIILGYPKYSYRKAVKRKFHQIHRVD